jgi:cell division protein FtsB
MKTTSYKSSVLGWGLWAAAVLLCIYLLIIVFGDHGLVAMVSMQEELHAIQQENARLEKENIALYRTIQRLKTDPAFIEQVARQELHMVRPGEIVFRFDNPAENDK